MSLGVKCGKKPAFDPKEVTKWWSEFRGEQWASIGDNQIWEATLPNNLIQNDFS